jgi:uncharacterized protein (TIGR02118 family)
MTTLSRRGLLARGGGIAASSAAASISSSGHAQAAPTPSELQRSDSARMIVVWKRPKDIEAFDRHYFGVHVPLAKKLPGLRKYEVSVGTIAMLGSAADTYLVATLHFDSLEAIRSAFATPEGKACAEDRRKLASEDGFQTFLFDSMEI